MAATVGASAVPKPEKQEPERRELWHANKFDRPRWEGKNDGAPIYDGSLKPEPPIYDGSLKPEPPVYDGSLKPEPDMHDEFDPDAWVVIETPCGHCGGTHNTLVLPDGGPIHASSIKDAMWQCTRYCDENMKNVVSASVGEKFHFAGPKRSSDEGPRPEKTFYEFPWRDFDCYCYETCDNLVHANFEKHIKVPGQNANSYDGYGYGYGDIDIEPLPTPIFKPTPTPGLKPPMNAVRSSGHTKKAHHPPPPEDAGRQLLSSGSDYADGSELFNEKSYYLTTFRMDDLEYGPIGLLECPDLNRYNVPKYAGKPIIYDGPPMKAIPIGGKSRGLGSEAQGRTLARDQETRSLLELKPKDDQDETR